MITGVGKKFLYEKVSDGIIQSIANGEYKADDLLPSERMIAEQFGVDRTTVRKALDYLAEKNIVEKRPGFGTVILPQAETSPEKSEDGCIGFFLEGKDTANYRLSQPFYSDLFCSLEAECKSQNYQLIYTTLSNPNDLTNFMNKNNVAGMIFVSEIDEYFIQQAKASHIPTVLIHRDVEGMINVSADHTDGAYQVISHLVEKGHKDIALITGPRHYQSAKDKFAGCLRAFFDYGIHVPEENIVAGDWQFDSGYDCAKEIFDRADGAPLPTALFCFNDMMCLGAIKAFKELNLSIPEDISIIGFDNMHNISYIQPDLSTVFVDTVMMAKSALWILLQQNTASTPFFNKVTTPVQLLEGKTVSDISTK